MRQKAKKLGILLALAGLLWGNWHIVRGVDLKMSSVTGRNPVTVTGNEMLNVGYSGDFGGGYYSTIILSAKTSSIASGQNYAVQGSTAYSQLRNEATGTYISSSNTTATNLKNLDDALSKTGIISMASGDPNTIEIGDPTTETVDGREVVTYNPTAKIGEFAANSEGLVTGGMVYSQVHLAQDGEYVEIENSTAENLKALDEKVLANTKDITNWKDMTNLSDTGITRVKTWAQAAVGMQETEEAASIQVIRGEKDADGNFIYTVTAKEATIDAGDTGLLTGGQIYNEVHVEDGYQIQAANTVGQNLKALDEQVVTNTADVTGLKDMTNLSTDAKNTIKSFATEAVKVAGEGVITVTPTWTTDADGGSNVLYTLTVDTGGIEKESAKLVTGDTIYQDVHLSEDGNYIRQEKTTAENLSALDTQVAANTDGFLALDQKVGDNIERLTADINQVGAQAAALAALHPEPYDPDDRWSFAVGYGHYRNGNAGALGVFFKPEEAATFSFGGTVWSGDPMINFGASFKRNRAANTKPTIRRVARRVRALEVAETERQAEATSQAKRIGRLEGAGAIRARRIAYLEAENQALQAENTAQTAAQTARAEEMAALRAENATLQAENAQIRQQIATILSRMAVTPSDAKEGERK